MNSLVIYYTRYGNTKAVAETIAATLAGAGEARAADLAKVTLDDLAKADLVVVGSPTHYQSLPKDVKARLKLWPRRSLRGKRIAAFDTSLKVWSPLMMMTASHSLAPRLRRLGGKPATHPVTFLVLVSKEDEEADRVTALQPGELERARAWAAGMLTQTGRRRLPFRAA